MGTQTSRDQASLEANPQSAGVGVGCDLGRGKGGSERIGGSGLPSCLA